MIGAITAGLYGTGAPAINGVFYSIATQTVGGGGASSITFSSIPSGYKHLQIRGIGLTSSAGGVILCNYNGDTGANYTRHRLLGNGSITNASGVTAQTSFNLFGDYVGTGASPIPTAMVVDILDYASISKLKTTRIFSGSDNNGSGEVELLSSLYSQSSISAISSITITVTGSVSTFNPNTTFALYGVK